MRSFLVLVIVVFQFHVADSQQSGPDYVSEAGSAAGLTSMLRPGEIADFPIFRLRKSVEEVRVSFTVSDRQNRPVVDLDSSEFTVLDNAVPVSKFTNFYSQANLPLHVGLLIDASASVEKHLRLEQQIGLEFLQTILSSSSDRAFVVAFGGKQFQLQSTTDQIQELQTAVWGIRPGGSTPLYDVIYQAAREMMKPEKLPSRRILLVISDGEDTVSAHSLRDAIEMAQRAEVAVYCISTRPKYAGDDVLHALSAQTGGLTFISSLSKLNAVFMELQKDLRSQYLITYKPPSSLQNGGFHPIKVLTRSNTFRVRSRTGYYPDLSP